MTKYFYLFLFLYSTYLSASFEPPTSKYLRLHSIDEIKYHLRLDNVTLTYKELFDKLIPKETEGFIGYHGDSVDYRIYQDIIRMTLEEIIGMDIPKDFHFLEIPCFKNQELTKLTDIPKFFLPEKDRSHHITEQLFPLNITLYANHNKIGFSSVSNFTNNSSQFKVDLLKKNLRVFFEELGIPPDTVNDAFEIGKNELKDDRGILLQLYDLSADHYSFANNNCYPSYPNGYPFANQTVSEYYYEVDASGYPTEIKLLLTNSHTLNPYSPLVIKRYDKIQPSVIKKYESALKDLISNVEYDPIKVEKYKNLLIKTWM